MKGSQQLKYLFFAMVIAVMVGASPIKNWTSGEYVTYTDLNAVLNHLHANLGHGHGPIITAADISPSAAIRPEQTTFGSNINRSMVYTGTWVINPDGGTAYLPVNQSGSLAVTVSKQSTYGVRLDAAAASGALADGGTMIYTVIFNNAGIDAFDGTCFPMTGGTNLASPLSFVLTCKSMGGPTWPLTSVNPTDISFAVYSNATN